MSSTKTACIPKQGICVIIIIMSKASLFYQGPDFVWHLDGYDKLKPYGFAIHGCIDGLVLCDLTCVHFMYLLLQVLT